MFSRFILNIEIGKISKNGDREYVTSMRMYLFACGNSTPFSNCIHGVGLLSYSFVQWCLPIPDIRWVRNGSYAFYGCAGLPVEDGLRYADTYLVEAADRTQSSYSIKDGTKWIGDDAFVGCSDFTSVTIPESVTTIGISAFSGCSGLTSITIPESVTIINSYTFQDCSGLTSITIPENVTTIGAYAFNGCSNLREVICKVTKNPIVESTGVPTVPIAPEPGIDPYDLVWLLPFNPAHPVEEATMSNYTETDNTDLYNKVYPEDECREKWTEYYQAVKDNLGTAARRLNVSQQVTIRMYSFMDTDRYLKRNGELVNKTTYINEWQAYENGIDQYEWAWEEYEYLSSMPETGSSVFSNVPQSEATLYVYASVIDAYRSIEPWSLFGTILPIDEEDPSAVETLSASEEVITTTNATAADAPIYDIMGRRLTEKPTSGIYIQNGRKYLVK